jgi:hypothetical protein
MAIPSRLYAMMLASGTAPATTVRVKPQVLIASQVQAAQDE